MGREIRRVAPNWKHPKRERYDMRTGQTVEEFHPLYDRAFAPKMREWYAEWEKWERGEKPDGAENTQHFWEWDGGPPDPEYCRPDWKPEEMAWWQVYETVSEGTPVTPPFATPEELVDYLATHGDFWDQKRGDGPWPRASAEKFVKTGWAPSMVIANGVIHQPRDGMPA
jgi:hypothetical protein